MSKISAAITAVGGYVPDFVLSNKVLETMVDTNDEWITSRTGIKERRILKKEGEGTSYLAINAAQNLIEKASINPEEIDLVIVATATPDMPVASTAAYTASKIGAVNAFSYDLQAACSSFLYALSTGASYIESGRYKKVLLIGADKMSSIIDYTDRTTCIIFGDGAGAVLLESNTEGLGLQDEYLRTDGIGREFLKIEAGGSITPPSLETLNNNLEIHAGIPGPATLKILISYATSCGISNSIRFLSKQAMNIAKLARSRTPDKLIADLADYKNTNPTSKLSKLHFYAFGGIIKTSEWLNLVNDFPLDIDLNNEFKPIKN